MGTARIKRHRLYKNRKRNPNDKKSFLWKARMELNAVFCYFCLQRRSLKLIDLVTRVVSMASFRFSCSSLLVLVSLLYLSSIPLPSAEGGFRRRGDRRGESVLSFSRQLRLFASSSNFLSVPLVQRNPLITHAHYISYGPYMQSRYFWIDLSERGDRYIREAYKRIPL